MAFLGSSLLTSTAVAAEPQAAFRAPQTRVARPAPVASRQQAPAGPRQSVISAPANHFHETITLGTSVKKGSGLY